VKDLSQALEAGPLDEEEEKYLIDLAALDEGSAVLITNAAAKSMKSNRAARKHFF
jgi:hypothetical protein